MSKDAGPPLSNEFPVLHVAVVEGSDLVSSLGVSCVSGCSGEGMQNLQASPGGCEEDRLKEGLEFLGTKALGHLSCESRGQEPAYSAPRHTVSPRVQRDTEAQVHADRQGQLKWVVQGPCTQPLGGGQRELCWGPCAQGWGRWSPMARRTQSATAFPEHCLSSASLASQGVRMFLQEHLRSSYDPPGTMDSCPDL